MDKHYLLLNGAINNPFSGENSLSLTDCYFIGTMLSDIEANKSSNNSKLQTNQTWDFSYHLNKTRMCPERRKALDDQKDLISALLEAAGITTAKPPRYGKNAKSGGGASGYHFSLLLQRKFTCESLYKLCEVIARDDNELFAGSLLVGVYDCKAYLDRGKMFSIDCQSKRVEKIIDRCLAKFGIKGVNHNPSRKRNKAKTRYRQLRMSIGQLAVFLHEIGFVWDFKHFEALECLPTRKDLSDRGRAAQAILNESGITSSSALATEDQPLLGVLNQNLLSGIEEVEEEAGQSERPAKKPSRYDYESTQKRQKRDLATVQKALIRCGWRCEIEANHKTFIRLRDGKDYLEPHHLIPLKARDRFEFDIDCPANVVMLCSKCHDEIHYGKERKKLIDELYKCRKQRLESTGLLKMADGTELNEKELLKMY